jgi:predicted Co/Zn/Cd cation transporter (cation efflux family)
MSGRLPDPVRRRRRSAIDAVLALVIVILMVQMWLLTAALESVLAGHHEVALPGFVTSLVLFAACLALYRLVVRLDRAPEPRDEPQKQPGPWMVG